MTDSNRSHITLIVDRTGSMDLVRTDAEGGVRTFIRGQQAVDLPATLLLVQFDDDGPFEVLHDGDLKSYTTQYVLTPRGMTPLLDAIGKGIVRTGEKLAAIPEDERSGKVFFVVQTDGEENASKEYTFERVNEMIKHQEGAYQWEFIWLGTGISAQQAFARVSQGTQSVHNTVAMASSGPAVGASYMMTSHNVAQTRAGAQNVTYGAKVDDEGNVIPDVPSKYTPPVVKSKKK